MGIKIKSDSNDIELFLEQEGESVILKAIGKDGCTWDIIKFLPDGTYRRVMNVDEGAGFCLNSRGQISEVD